MKQKQLSKLMGGGNLNHTIPMSIRQKGASLIEMVAYLGLAGMVIAGALAMFTGASSSQGANQLTQDIVAVRTSTKSLWNATANYGTVNMLSTLSQAKRLPSTWNITGTGASMTANHPLNGKAGVIGLTGLFAITLDGITADVCTSVISQQGNQGWNSVYVGAASGAATPLSTGAVTDFGPTAVGTTCAGATKKVTFVSS